VSNTEQTPESEAPQAEEPATEEPAAEEPVAEEPTGESEAQGEGAATETTGGEWVHRVKADRTRRGPASKGQDPVSRQEQRGQASAVRSGELVGSYLVGEHVLNHEGVLPEGPEGGVPRLLWLVFPP
jgi:hypothetical protein